MVPGVLCAVISLTPMMLQLLVKCWKDSMELVSRGASYNYASRFKILNLGI